MSIQNYFIVENNVVTNVVMWDGNTNSWTPPINSIALVESTTPALIWEATIVDNEVTGWNLTEQIGVGGIGFTWDGVKLTTNQPQP